MPVATRTRRSTKLQHPSTAEKTKNITGKLQMETEEKVYSFNSDSKSSSNKTGSQK